VSTLEPETVTIDTDYYKALEAVALAAGMLRSMAWTSERQTGPESVTPQTACGVTDYRIDAFVMGQLDAALKDWYASQRRQDDRRRQARHAEREQAQMRLM